MKKIVYFLFSVLVTVNVFATTASQIAEEIASEMQVSLPLKVDFITTLVDISSRGNVLSYEYTLGVTLSEYSEMFDGILTLEQSVIDQNCSSPLLKRVVLGKGVKLRHSYYDMNHLNLLDSFIVDKYSCK
jgi:hypothetical protein